MHTLARYFTRRFTLFAEWTCISILFFLPWQTRFIIHQGTLGGEPWEYGTISLYGVDLLVVALVITALLARFTAPPDAPRNYRRFSAVQWMALLLLFVALFSLNAAENSFTGLFWWAKLAEGIALFLVIPSLALRWERAALAIVVSALVQSALAITQFVTQTVWGHALLGMASQNPATVGTQVIDTGVMRILRAYGSLPHPNMAAGWMTIAIVIALVLLTGSTLSQWQQRLALFALPVLSTGLWTTLSRQAVVALGVVIVLMIAATFIRERSFPRQTTSVLLIAITPLVVFSILFPDLFSTRVNADTRLEHASIAERTQYTEQSIQLLRASGLRGVGIGNFTAAAHELDRQYNAALPSHSYQPVHNVPLLVLTELGILGMLAFMLFLFHLIAGTTWRDPAQYCWSLCLIALGVISMFDHYLWTLHFGVLFFWLIASLHEQSKGS